MTTTQRLTWTALPWNRAPDGRLRITAMLSPRLATDAVARPTLGGQFHDFVDWPAIANATTWSVVLGDATQLQAERLSGPAESDVWKRLFPPKTFVRPFVFRDHSVRRLRSYPVRAVLAYARDLYRDVARTSPQDLPGAPGTPGAHPRLAELAGDLGELLGVNEKTLRETNPKRLRNARDSRRLRADAWGLDLRAAGADPTQDFAAAQRFFERPELRDEYLEEPDAGLVPPGPDPPDIDFHQMLGLLGDHPSLMRRLGLAVDLAIDGEIPAGTGTIRVAPSYGQPHPNPVFGPPFRPWTAYRVEAALFFAAPKGAAELADAMLRLDGAGDALDLASPSLFDLVQVDSDGAALRLVATASTLYALQLARPRNLTGIDTPDAEGLPTLRSAGLSVVHKGRAPTLSQRLVDTKGLDGQTDENAVVLGAEDVTRGYRLDVKHDDRKWRSLHRRVGSYELHGDSLGPDVHDEGYVKSTSATSADDKDSDLHVHEALARWSGWSLAAERPGRLPYAESTTVPGADGHPDKVRQEEEVRERGPATLATPFKLESRYHVEPGSLPRLRFGSSYRLRARAVDLAGNSLDADDPSDDHASDPVDYLRFEPVLPPDLVPLAPYAEGESLQRLVIRSDWDDAAAGPCERHVVPPKTSQLLAELHGLFDDAIGRGLPHDAAFAVATREGALLSDAPGSTMHPGPPAPPDWPPDRDPPGTYLVNPERSLLLPYLPDPLSRGASLRGLPGAGGAARRGWGADAWPDAHPFILRVEERAALPESIGACTQTFPDDGPPVVEWDEEARVLTVRLEKGEVRAVRLSSFFAREDLRLLGVWRWAEGSPDDGALIHLATHGEHWMLTPFRTLVLVHAVRRPLCAPQTVKPGWPDEFFPDGLRADRTAGLTYAELSCGLRFSARTSGQIDVAAAWAEPVDELVEDAPVFDRHGKAHVATVPVPDGLPPGPNSFPFRLEKQRKAPDPIRHEFGDTKHRYVQYRLTATTRFREYFPPGTDPAELRITGDVINVHVPSSARPEPPRPRYAVPTFGWHRTNTPDDPAGWRSTQRVREGGALRVYLERGWFSSGADELLGIVCWTAAGTVPPEQTKLFSQIGRDPIWNAQPPAGVLAATDVANAARREDGLALAEVPGVTAGVAGVEPKWDDDRKRWYADILLPGPAQRSYFPFVRLALARYQHFAAASDLKLSRIATLDFAQLVPDRTLRVDWIGDGADVVDVSLAGVAPDGPNLNSVEVTIEHHDGTIPGELGWRPWPGVAPIVLAEGVRHPGRWLDHLEVSESVRETLGLQHRLTHVAPPGKPHEGIDPAHIPTIATEHAARLRLIPEWIDLGERIPILLLPGHRLWSGRLRLPALRGSQPLRLVVREYETYVTDAEAAGSHNPEPRTYHGRRVVFADFVEF